MAFVSRTIADDVIIVPVRGGVGDLESIFTLNAVGASIWKLIDGRTSLQALAVARARGFEVSEAAAAADVQEFVELLSAKGLVSKVFSMNAELRSYGDFSAQIYRRARGGRLPTNGTIELTHRCPLACAHCYNNLPVGDAARARASSPPSKSAASSTRWPTPAASGCC